MALALLALNRDMCRKSALTVPYTSCVAWVFWGRGIFGMWCFVFFFFFSPCKRGYWHRIFLKKLTFFFKSSEKETLVDGASVILNSSKE